MYILDTNSCIYWLKGRSDSLAQRIRETDPREISVTAITAAELHFGFEKSAQREHNLSRLAIFLSAIQQVPFDLAAAAHFGEIKHDLWRRGKLIGVMDLLIAASARANGAVLVTNNTKDFVRVPGLAIEDWTQPAASASSESDSE